MSVWLHPVPCPAQLSDYLQQSRLFPDHDVVIVSSGVASWKNDWDEARRKWRAGNYSGAEEWYRKLLSSKGNIAEARWELAQVLIKLEHWKEAGRELELLVEVPPVKVEYLNALGLVLRNLGQYGRALEVFDKAYALAPDNFTALVGLTQGLVEVGRKEEAFPLFQKVVSQKNEDLELRLALANLAFELGRLETSRKQLKPLADAKDANLDTLLMAARIHEGLGRENEAARYWERSLVLAPGNREAQGRLALHYENRGQLDKALGHLLALLEKNPQNTSLLSRICRIYVQTDRFSQALPFFERYVKLKPDKAPDALPAIINFSSDEDDEQIAFFRRLLAISPDDLGVLNNLASELEAAGNPEGALFMWEHVARVAPDRVEVYRAIAELLEKMGREEQLIEVLETLHRLDPADMKLIDRLARLQGARGNLEASLDYYNKLEKRGYQGQDLYVGRADIYLEKNQPTGALGELQKLLDLYPGRYDIRRRSVMLAGELGDQHLLIRLSEDMENSSPPGDRGQDLLLFAEAFGRAGDFSRASIYFQRAMSVGDESTPGASAERQLMRQVRLGLSELYRSAGLNDESEQILRQGVLSGDGVHLFIRGLFELALSSQPPKLGEAQAWFSQYQQQAEASSGDIVFCRAQLLSASGEFRRAERILRRLIYELASGEARPGSDGKDIASRQAGLRLAETLLAAGQTTAAEQQCLAMMGVYADPEILVLLQNVYRQAGDDEAAAKISSQLLQRETDGIRLLKLADLYMKHGLFANQAEAAAMAYKKWPVSLSAGLLLTQAFLEQGNLSEALPIALELLMKFPDCSAVNFLLAQVYYQNTNYQLSLHQCDLVLEKEPGRLDVYFLKLRCEMAMGHRAAAERMVQEVFPLPTGEIFRKELRGIGLTVPTSSGRKSLWQKLIFSEVDPDYIGEVLGMPGEPDNSGRGASHLVLELATRLLPRYRWEKRFGAVVREN